MKRRKFIQSSLAASAFPLTYAAGRPLSPGDTDLEKECLELRTYEMRFGGNRQVLIDYLMEVLAPALKRKGVNHVHLFSEMGQSSPSHLRLLISYPDASIYLAAQDLSTDKDYQSAAQSYHALTKNEAVYNRYTSSLMLAFDGMPQMAVPAKDAGLFELRIYEGYSEDAVRRKIKMFDTEEIPLFHEVGLHPVFFGEMISGPYRPCLVYLLYFRDMEERDANWQKFFDHPDWNRMKVKEEYADSVSHIRREFLLPM